MPVSQGECPQQVSSIEMCDSADTLCSTVYIKYWHFKTTWWAVNGHHFTSVPIETSITYHPMDESYVFLKREFPHTQFIYFCLVLWPGECECTRHMQMQMQHV